MVTITFQNLFRMYNKLSGMTGTAKTEEEEFRDIYNMYVIQIPTNKPVIREDYPDLVFATGKGKFAAIVRKIKEISDRLEKGGFAVTPEYCEAKSLVKIAEIILKSAI